MQAEAVVNWTDQAGGKVGHSPSSSKFHHRLKEISNMWLALLVAAQAAPQARGSSGFTVDGWDNLVKNHPVQAVAVALGVSLFWGILGVVAGNTAFEKIKYGGGMFFGFMAFFACMFFLSVA
jgi:hypothetical protein